MVVAKVRKIRAVNKQKTHGVNMERFNLKILNEVEGKEQYRVEISNRLATLENLKTLRWILLELGKLLKRISKFQSKRV
jgi:hypothetical protein